MVQQFLYYQPSFSNRECIERLAAKAHSDNKQTLCPECREIVDISDMTTLRPAFFINRLMPVVRAVKLQEVASELRHEHRCDVEPTAEAVAVGHHSVSDYSGHEGCSSSTLPDTNYLQCAKHSKRRKVFCRDCKMLVCLQCAVISHRNHDCEDVDAECIRKCKGSLKLQLEPVRKQFNKLKDAMQKCEERALVIKNQASMVANKIHQAFDEVDPTYLLCREATLSRLYQMEEMKVKAINLQQKALEVTLSDLESSLQLGDEFLNKGPGDELQSLARLEVLTSRISAFNLEDTLQLLAEPRTDSNIAIEIAEPIPTNISEKYCRLYLLQPDPSRCSASGTGLLEAETANTSKFHFHLEYANGLPCSEEQDISVSIQSSVSGQVEAQVSYQVNGDYEVTYTPKSRGRHAVRVVVNGKEISGSPFQLFVSNPPLHLSNPVRVIKGDGLSEIDGLTMNTNEQLVVSEKMRGQVSIWEKSGKKLKVIKVSEFLRCHVSRTPFLCRPTGVAVDKDGCIYVADNFSHCPAKFSKDGSKLLKIICREGPRNGELKSPGGIRISEKGEVLVCDCANHRVQVFDQTLQFQRSFGKKGADSGEFNWPVDLDFDSSGNIYVSDMDNDRIQVFDADEKFVRSFGTRGSEPGQLDQPVFLFVDRDNYLYVSENHNHRVSIFRTSGDFVQVLGEKGEQEGKMTSPKGITKDKDGFLYIGERGNKRIQIF